MLILFTSDFKEIMIFWRNKKGLVIATVAFSHFYKIPLVPKVTKFIFYNMSSSLLTLSPKHFFGMFALRKNIFLMGNQKWQKKIEFENWKSPKLAKYQDLGFSTFQIQIVFVIFGLPSNKILFLKENILLSYQKNFEADSINRQKDML